MLFVVRFTDKPDRLATRKEFLPAHIAWLDQHKDMILVAGSLRPDHGEEAIGGLWIVDAKDRKTIEALLLTDPFWVQGLRNTCEIMYWSKAFPDRRVPI
jgi:uncharacterized protein